MTVQMLSAAGLRRRFSLTYRQQESIAGWLLIAPWLIGFLAFTAGPMLASIGLSLTQWDLLTPPKFVGLANYVRMATDDPSVGRSLRVTTVYAFVSVPLSVALGLFVALLLNQKIRFQNFIRTVYR